MRRRGKGKGVGLVFFLAGVAILLAIIMPPGFWWFALSIGLMVFGIWMIKCT